MIQPHETNAGSRLTEKAGALRPGRREAATGPSDPGAKHPKRKEVIFHEKATSALEINNPAFTAKLLCDGPVLNCGVTCAFSCAYCYVPSFLPRFFPDLLKDNDLRAGPTVGQARGTQDVVVRKRNPLGLVAKELVREDGKDKYPGDGPVKVVFASTLVDVAANKILLQETADVCNFILAHTPWHIRLLSKCSLLKNLVEDQLIPEEYHQRLIFGFSTGTLDEKVSRAIERGTSAPETRIKALQWLQDEGLRTYGMVCPSLPQRDYAKFSREVCSAIRVAKCEHVWGEVINARGDANIQTVEALRKAGLNDEADMLNAVVNSTPEWESYAQATFCAHKANVPADKLRFLEYIDANTPDWWAKQRKFGAVLLGQAADDRNIAGLGSDSGDASGPQLSRDDVKFWRTREKRVGSNSKSSIATAEALFELYSYKDGILWKKKGHKSFGKYCQSKWDLGRANTYRLLASGELLKCLKDKQSQSTNVDWKLPRNEGQIRPLLKLQAAHRIPCWVNLARGLSPKNLTAGSVMEGVSAYLKDNRDAPLHPLPAGKPSSAREAGALLTQLMAAVERFPGRRKILSHLRKAEPLIRGEIALSE